MTRATMTHKRHTTQQTFKKMSTSTMKQTANKRQPTQDQVRVNNSHKSIIEGGLARYKTQTTSLKPYNVLKKPHKSKQIVPHNQTQHEIRKIMHQVQINLNLTQPHPS